MGIRKKDRRISLPGQKVRAVVCLLLCLLWTAGATAAPLSSVQAHVTCGHCFPAASHAAANAQDVAQVPDAGGCGQHGQQAAHAMAADAGCCSSNTLQRIAVSSLVDDGAQCKCSLQAPLAPGAHARAWSAAAIDAPQVITGGLVVAPFLPDGAAYVATSFLNRAPPLAKAPRFLLLQSFRC